MTVSNIIWRIIYTNVWAYYQLVHNGKSTYIDVENNRIESVFYEEKYTNFNWNVNEISQSKHDFKIFMCLVLCMK